MNDCTYCGSISTYKRGCKPCAKSYNDVYRQKNAHKLKQQHQKWRDTHKVEKAAMDHNWYLKNGEKKRSYQKEFRLKNREYYIEYFRNYFAKYSAEHVASVTKWRKDNPEKFKALALRTEQNRRTRQMNCEGSYTQDELINLFASYPYCVLCKRTNRKLTIDHIIPLAKNGTNYITNIQPLCKSCNCKKNDRILTDEEILNWSN